MGFLRYRCPTSLNEVKTGIDTRKDILARMQEKELTLWAWCPHCMEGHQIKATEAVLDEPLRTTASPPLAPTPAATPAPSWSAPVAEPSPSLAPDPSPAFSAPAEPSNPFAAAVEPVAAAQTPTPMPAATPFTPTPFTPAPSLAPAQPAAPSTPFMPAPPVAPASAAPAKPARSTISLDISPESIFKPGSIFKARPPAEPKTPVARPLLGEPKAAETAVPKA